MMMRAETSTLAGETVKWMLVVPTPAKVEARAALNAAASKLSTVPVMVKSTLMTGW
jgi:hypothetical protein